MRTVSRAVTQFSQTETGKKVGKAIDSGTDRVSKSASKATAEAKIKAEIVGLRRRAKRVTKQLQEQLDAGAISQEEFDTRSRAVAAKCGADVSRVDARHFGAPSGVAKKHDAVASGKGIVIAGHDPSKRKTSGCYVNPSGGIYHRSTCHELEPDARWYTTGYARQIGCRHCEQCHRGESLKCDLCGAVLRPRKPDQKTCTCSQCGKVRRRQDWIPFDPTES